MTPVHTDDAAATTARHVALDDLMAVLREQHSRKFDIVAAARGDPGARWPAFLLSCLHPATGTGPGTAREFLPGGFTVIDNLDIVPAVLEGVRRAWVPAPVEGCDLTGRRMYIRIACDQVKVPVPVLSHGHRSPSAAAAPAGTPAVVAGLVISSSETGCGAFTGTPRLAFGRPGPAWSSLVMLSASIITACGLATRPPRR